MKKHYERPLLLVERFELTQKLSNCSLLIGLNDSACVLKDEDSTFMMKDLALQQFFNADACVLHPIGMEGDDGLCYHINVNMVFSS